MMRVVSKPLGTGIRIRSLSWAARIRFRILRSAMILTMAPRMASLQLIGTLSISRLRPSSMRTVTRGMPYRHDILAIRSFSLRRPNPDEADDDTEANKQEA